MMLEIALLKVGQTLRVALVQSTFNSVFVARIGKALQKMVTTVVNA